MAARATTRCLRASGNGAPRRGRIASCRMTRTGKATPCAIEAERTPQRAARCASRFRRGEWARRPLAGRLETGDEHVDLAAGVGVAVDRVARREDQAVFVGIVPRLPGQYRLCVR